MQYNPLGRTGLSVSALCLGTMTWGTQNTEAEAHRQMDFAVERGINFFDTAEMYPTNPVSAETVGLTERYIGSWFAARGRRDDVILATKITGSGHRFIRDGGPITAAGVQAAVEDSLKRLNTDHIDLYQLHWPNRGSYHFRKSWTFDASTQDSQATLDNMRDVLEALDRLVKVGKIRAIGLSNESAWGAMQYLKLAEAHGLPRVASIQNEYNLICRLFDLDLAEVAHHEDVGLLAFSPLAAGLLTGKYRDGAVPAGSRRSRTPDLGGRYTPEVEEAVDAYLAVAARHGLDPAQMALAFCLTRPFMTSVIIGATSMEQLETDIGAADLVLSNAVMDDIAKTFCRFGKPM